MKHLYLKGSEVYQYLNFSTQKFFTIKLREEGEYIDYGLNY